MRPPNLLFLYTDEQAFNTLAAYGNHRIDMPNLDGLARESVVFDEAYVTQPVCTPSRSSLLTGLTPHTNGCVENNIPLRDETPCLPEMASDGTWATGHFGKWHLGDELFAQHGFREWVGIEDGYNKYFREGLDRDTPSDYHNFLIENGFTPENGRRFGRGEATRLPEEWGKPAFLARRASDFIRRHRNEPFILYVNFLEPHMPFFGPRDGQYPPENIPLPPNFDAAPTEEQPLKTRLLRDMYERFGHSGLDLATEGDWRRMISNYWGLCSLVDTHVGTILSTLAQCGLDDDTIVVFTSDHGDMMGAHRLLAKCVMYQEAVRVPLLVRAPGLAPGRVAGPVSQIDLVPTLLDLMGCAAPDHLEGRSLRPAIEAGRVAEGDDVFIEWTGPVPMTEKLLGRRRPGPAGDMPPPPDDEIPDWVRAVGAPEDIRASVFDPVRTVISTDGWKLNASPLGEHELYHLASDPEERRNVFADRRPKARELADRIRRWQERTDDAVVLPDF